jgi:phenylalanyl-tRNA synthetase alpha chain
MDELTRIAEAVETALQAARTPEAVEEVRRSYLSRKGAIARLFDDLPTTPPADRPARGRMLNDLRQRIERQVAARLAEVGEADREARLAAEAIDVTLPGRRPKMGRLHLLSQTLAEVQRIFHGMGFEVVEGPDVETDEFNFERLNMGRDHPARDAQDSFYLSDDLLLRTHTTVVDARIMVGRTPPMRILTTGRCYRRDAPDWKRMPVFHQVDGFMVGESITMANLKGVLSSFALQLFGPATRTKFVPGYFPFTEPSAEMYVYFNEQWMELGGCGMFHPRVLEMAGIDPQRYSAFAFGLGVDRQVMVRYGIPDIRLFWDNDLRLLEQF